MLGACSSSAALTTSSGLTKSNSLPVVLGLFGFLGGILAFGFIGVFLGPTLLAVGYSLFLEWHAAEVEELCRRPKRL